MVMNDPTLLQLCIYVCVCVCVCVWSGFCWCELLRDVVVPTSKGSGCQRRILFNLFRARA